MTSGLSRRELLGSAAVVGGWVLLGEQVTQAQETRPQTTPAAESGPYQLPPLPYGYADLEPFVNAQTMKLHHDIHHAGYVRGANEAVAELEAIRQQGGDRSNVCGPLPTSSRSTCAGTFCMTSSGRA